MPSGDSGINKPFDRLLKYFMDEEPRLFLRLLGFEFAETEVDLQPLRPETAPPVVMPDFVAVARIKPGEHVVVHAEFLASYHSRVLRTMARYGGSLGWQHQLPVESALVLLRPEGVPAQVPEIGDYAIGQTHTTHPFKVVRLWEVDPTPVLETDNPKLLPLGVMLKTTDEQVRRIAAILMEKGDEESRARFLLLGSLRYDRDTLFGMLGGGSVGFEEAVREALREREREQVAELVAKEVRKEARKVLRIALRAKFPGLENLPEIDRISSLETLEALIDSAFRTSDQDAVERAVRTAAANPN